MRLMGLKFTILFLLLLQSVVSWGEENMATKEVLKSEQIEYRLKADAGGAAVENGGNDVIKMVVALSAIIALIFGMAWLSRRFNLHSAYGSGIKIITAASVGSKEKLLIVEVENRRLLLGVTSNQINLIKELEQEQSTALPDSEFSSRIKSLLTGKVSSDE